MKKIILILTVCTALTSCNQIARATDSEISAIRDQTEVLIEHNKLVEKQNTLIQNLIDELEFENEK